MSAALRSRLLVQFAIVGGIVSGLPGATIYFEPEEPYPGFITTASALHGALAALLAVHFIDHHTRIWKAGLAGALCGLALGLMGFLAKGGWASWDAPFIVPHGLIFGAVIGIIMRWLCVKDQRASTQAAQSSAPD